MAPKYLIGGGEKLSVDISRPRGGGGDKAHPYSFGEAREQLSPLWRSTADAINKLPLLALPEGEAVVEITLHPTYLAKSYYPGHLIDELKLRHLGSRAVHITPRKVATKKAAQDPRPQPAPLLYLAGPAKRLAQFSRALDTWSPLDEHVRDEFRQIEMVAVPGDDRAKFPSKNLGSGDIALEVVLHADAIDDAYVVDGFEQYLLSLGLTAALNRRRFAGGLCFVPMRAPGSAIDDLLQFAFLRAVRPMPRVVALEPMVRSLGKPFKVSLPDADALAPDLSVAIFDGGLPPDHGLDRWVTHHDAPGVGAALPAGQAHGLAVTSAFLFGPLPPAATPAPPPAKVDHWRIIGDDTKTDDFELYTLLDRIEDVLGGRPYDFVNISVGPCCAMEDDDVNGWTSTLDTILSTGDTVATVACGNNGEADQALGLNRVQPPSDGVNMIATGAANSPNADWSRAPYSAVGPGRSPGYIKPDLVTFGGSHEAPFLVLASKNTGTGTLGTSFAAPLALRAGACIRSQFVEPLWAPTLKALLIHHAALDGRPRGEVGWGRLSHTVADLVLCEDGEAHVIYQRQMPATGSVRLYLPVPKDLKGAVEIKATFCLFCDVDPEDAINYTRGGLDVQFRPDTHRIPPPYEKNGKIITPTVPATDSFFGAKDFYASEFARREDAQKWETTISRTKTKRATSLNDPAFDVSHIVREHGQRASRTPNIKFALVLSLKNRHAKNLYDRVVAQSGARLQPMRARTGVPIPVRTKKT